ncbi:hypothetical protein [Bosea sp. LjRoot237]|uniref:hypothetical protein n=1 Tax=Bosea sp. LjRoot237 TaxID=3342292 RepID=UPI003ECCDCE9
MQAIRFDGRILFLSADPDVVGCQIGGEDIDLAAAGRHLDGRDHAATVARPL